MIPATRAPFLAWHDQLLAEQIAGDFEDVGAGVEIARKFFHWSRDYADYESVPQITQMPPHD